MKRRPDRSASVTRISVKHTPPKGPTQVLMKNFIQSSSAGMGALSDGGGAGTSGIVLAPGGPRKAVAPHSSLAKLL